MVIGLGRLVCRICIVGGGAAGVRVGGKEVLGDRGRGCRGLCLDGC